MTDAPGDDNPTRPIPEVPDESAAGAPAPTPADAETTAKLPPSTPGEPVVAGHVPVFDESAPSAVPAGAAAGPPARRRPVLPWLLIGVVGAAMAGALVTVLLLGPGLSPAPLATAEPPASGPPSADATPTQTATPEPEESAEPDREPADPGRSTQPDDRDEPDPEPSPKPTPEPTTPPSPEPTSEPEPEPTAEPTSRSTPEPDATVADPAPGP